MGNRKLFRDSGFCTALPYLRSTVAHPPLGGWALSGRQCGLFYLLCGRQVRGGDEPAQDPGTDVDPAGAGMRVAGRDHCATTVAAQIEQSFISLGVLGQRCAQRGGFRCACFAACFTACFSAWSGAGFSAARLKRASGIGWFDVRTLARVRLLPAFPCEEDGALRRRVASGPLDSPCGLKASLARTNQAASDQLTSLCPALRSPSSGARRLHFLEPGSSFLHVGREVGKLLHLPHFDDLVVGPRAA